MRLGKSTQHRKQPFARAQVKTRTRFIEQQEFWISHDSASDEYPFLLTVAERTECPLLETLEVPFSKNASGLSQIKVVILLSPASLNGIRRRQHRVEDGLPSWNPLGLSRRCETDSCSQLKNIDTSQTLIKNVDGSRRRIVVSGRKLKKRRLP